jgi:hypothetical protein
VAAAVTAAREYPIIVSNAAQLQPSNQGLLAGVRNFKLNWSASFLLCPSSEHLALLAA